MTILNVRNALTIGTWDEVYTVFVYEKRQQISIHTLNINSNLSFEQVFNTLFILFNMYL